jgi:hypothetical protein
VCVRQSEQPCLSLSKTSKTGFLRGLSEAAAKKENLTVMKKTHRLDARRLEIERLYTAVVVSEADFESDQVF